MTIKKIQRALILTSTLFLSLTMSQAFAKDGHCDIKETQLAGTMKHIKSELRAYVNEFKKGDQQMMQKHLNELLKLSEEAYQYTPQKIAEMHHGDMKMDHSKMDMKTMPAMDHSKMDHGDMKMDHSKMDMKSMPAMDHSAMNHGDMKMDHSKMDMKSMPAMDHSKMDHGDMKMDHSKMDMKSMPAMDHSKMNHGDMKMDSATHDMSTMPSMEGMTPEQHHQHMKYMQGMTKLQHLFNALNKTKDDAEIKAILGKIKHHSKKSHQQFRQEC